MEFWDEKAKPSILVAVKVACEAIREELAAELQHRDQSRHNFLTEEVERLKDAAARSEQLENENQRLKKELEELRNKHHTAVSYPTPNQFALASSSISVALDRQDPENSRQALGKISPNKATVDAEPDREKDYVDLAKRYRELQARFEAKRSAAKRVKDERDTWVRYAERLEVKYKKLERQQHHGLVEVPLSGTANKPAAPLQAEEPRDFNTSFASNPESSTGFAIHADAVEEARRARRAASTPVNTTSEQPPACEHPNGIGAIDEGAADDADKEPELPSLPPASNANQHVLIKQEPSSDVPVVISERNLRKRKSEEVDGVWPSPCRIKSERWISSDPVVAGELTAFSPHESLDLDAEQRRIPTPKKQKITDDKGREGKGAPEPPPAGASTHAARPAREAGRRRALPWGPSPKSTGPQPGVSADWSMNYAVFDVAVDVVETPSSPVLEQTPQVLHRRVTKGARLQDLLNRTGSAPDPVVLRPTRLARDPYDTKLDLVALRTNGRKTETCVKTPAREPPVPKSNRSAAIGQAQQGNNVSKPGQLRRQPLAELRMEDFKINPKLNNGYSHAFEEVVRDKASRAELEGCVDPNCCGKKFRAMAQSELDNGGPAILSRVSDIELLERYLGDEGYRLIGMARPEREKLWLEARTRELANKYGRHRHRFARRPSPPGFWDTDFPTTQEVQENREEGGEIERRIIEDRWREAMRGGGRWLFKDE